MLAAMASKTELVVEVKSPADKLWAALRDSTELFPKIFPGYGVRQGQRPGARPGDFVSEVAAAAKTLRDLDGYLRLPLTGARVLVCSFPPFQK